jgi:hypothetical protein
MKEIKKISKNLYRGELVTSANEIIQLAKDRKSIYNPSWGVKPAAILMSMHFSLVMRLVNDRNLWKTERKQLK